MYLKSSMPRKNHSRLRLWATSFATPKYRSERYGNSFGTTNMATASTAAAAKVVNPFRASRLEKTRLRSFSPLRTAAISRTPITEMPIVEKTMNQLTMLSTKLQMPIFDTPSTLDTYGYVIRGKT